MTDQHDQITQLKKYEDQVILMVDINEHVLSKILISFFLSLFMSELTLEKHGDKGPTTTRRNLKEYPIDGIWGTAALNISVRGYLTFNHELNSDHRLIWVSIPHTKKNLDARPPLRAQSSRKINKNHPRVQGKPYPR